MVLGHENCGAVAAALDCKFRQARHGARIELLVQNILPGHELVDPHAEPEAQVAQAVEANVRWTLRQITDTPEWRVRTAEGTYLLKGAVFEIATGRVRFLDLE